MATAVAHSIVGLAGGHLAGRGVLGSKWRWYLFAVVAANAADFDFLPGLLVGDANRYHHFASHSIFAALLFGFLVALAVVGRYKHPLKLGVVSAIIYATHLLLDFFTGDARAPYGIPLFWPISDEHFIASFTIFGGVKHGVPGQDVAVVMQEIFSRHNLKVLLYEAVVLAPILVISWITAAFRTRPPR